jgi:hypothetical protein
MIFGNEDQIKIWESMVADYGGRVYRSAGKAAGVQDDASGWDRFRNFPGVKQFIDSMPITAAINGLQYSFLKNPPSAADFSPMSPGGKVYNIGTVQVQTDSGNLDELIYNNETTTEKMKGKGN